MVRETNEMKKICMILVLAFLLMATAASTVFADVSNPLTVSGEAISTSKGDTLVYQIKAAQNGRIYPASVRVTWAYDTSVFTLVSMEMGDLYYPQFEEMFPTALADNSYEGFIYSEKKEGVFVTLTFKVSEACDAKTYPITVNAEYYNDTTITENPVFGFYPDISSKYNCYSVSAQNGSITVNDHIYGAWTSISDTEHMRTCTLCSGKQYADHRWDDGEVRKAASCISEGLKVYTCKDCGHTKDEILPKTKDHVYGDWREYSEKQHQRSCECGDTQYAEHVLGGLNKHDENQHKQLCECGYVFYSAHSFGGYGKHDAENHKKVCACGEESYAAHTWNSGVVTKPAQHLEEGIRTYTCTVCSETKEESIPKTTTHNYTLWEKHDENQHKRTCRCGDTQYADHEWDEGVITKPATNQENGVRTYTCGVCSETKEEIVPRFEGSAGLAFRDNGDGTYYVSGIGTCTDTDIVIPAVTPEGAKVTGIGRNAFKDNKTITSILIPSGVTSIGNYAFRYCSALVTVTLPASLTELGSSVFQGCTSLASVSIPSGIKALPLNTFSGCTALAKATLPSGLLEIGNSAFRGCSALSGLKLPASVTTIGEFAFYNCAKLTTVTIPSGVTEIPNSAFYGCKALVTVDLPENLTAIGASAFDSCIALTEIRIPNTVLTIGANAFSYCDHLTTLTIGDHVSEIGKSAFSGCKELKSVVIPDSVTVIGDSAFSSCTELTEIRLSKNLTSLGKSCFAGCKDLESMVVPKTLTTIGTNVFDNCKALVNIYYFGTASEMEGSAVSEALPDGVKIFYYAEIKPEEADGSDYWHYENGDIAVWVLVMRGDFDGDEKITASDALYLLRHLLMPNLYPSTQSADVNSDGVTNPADALYLLRHALMPNIYPLK